MPGMGPSSETTPREAPVSLHEVEYDVRRKRPPALSFLLRWETARRIGRVGSLLALDFAAVFIAIYTALALKALARGLWSESPVLETTKQYVSFAFLLTALLFAQSGLYNNRAERPGLSRIVSSLTAVAAVALVYAVVNGERFSSYYIFYGSLFFAVAFVASFRFGYELLTGAILRAAGYARRAILVGSGDHIESVAQALDQGPASIHVVGFVSLQPRSSDGLRSLGRFEDLPRLVTEQRIDEVIIADPAFPEQQAVEGPLDDVVEALEDGRLELEERDGLPGDELRPLDEDLHRRGRDARPTPCRWQAMTSSTACCRGSRGRR